MRMSKYVLTILLILSGYGLTAQVYNPIPQYVFRNKLGVGRSTPVDQAAYMNIGPNGGANQGVVLPRVADTLSILGTKRHGLLIFSRQLNKFAWWDSTGNKWTEVGSGSGSASGEVLLGNGSQTVGDSLLVSTPSGDTAYFKNLLAGPDFTITLQGDTVLVLNAKNIGNTDLRVTDAERILYVGEDTSFAITNPDQSSVDFSIFNDGNEHIREMKTRPKRGQEVQLSLQANSVNSGGDSTSAVFISQTNNAYYAHRAGVYGSRQINLDSSGIEIQGIVFGDVIEYSSASNHNLDLRNASHVLNDLTGAASRTITLHPKPNGAIIRVINQSSDGTNKWSFAGSTVYDKNGSTVTTLDDHTCYELMYMNATLSNFGAGWHIIKKY